MATLEIKEERMEERMRQPWISARGMNERIIGAILESDGKKNGNPCERW